MLRVNVHSGVGQVHACFSDFLRQITTVPAAALKVSGPEAGRAFALRFGRDPHAAARHAVEAFLELRDCAGQWGALDILVGSGANDAPLCGQGQIEDAGAPRYHGPAPHAGGQGEVGRHGGVLPEDRRRRLARTPPLAKVVPSSHGTPEVLWNDAAELMATGLDKTAIMGELGSLLPQGPAEPKWSR